MTITDVQKLIQSKVKRLQSQIGSDKGSEVETDEEWDARQAGLSMAINVLAALSIEIDRKNKP